MKKNKHEKTSSEEPICEHNWRNFRPRKLGIKTINTAYIVKKCSLCNEFRIEKFIIKEFRHGKL